MASILPNRGTKTLVLCYMEIQFIYKAFKYSYLGIFKCFMYIFLGIALPNMLLF